MAIKTVKQSEGGEDILGLVAFGSLIGNIFQIASKESLKKQNEDLWAYARELKLHYDNMRARAKLVYNENLELKRANEGFMVINNRLLKELIEAKDEVRKLKGGSPVVSRRRRKQVRMRNGGAQ